jgi:PAS domain S-box-containing protein
MINTLRNFLAPPQFEDREKSRNALLLNFVTLALFSAISIATFVSFIINGSAAELLPRFLVITILSVIAQVLMRQGYVRPAALILVTVLWIALFLFTYRFYASVRSPSFASLITALVLTSLLFGRKGSFWGLGAATLIGLTLTYLDSQNLLPTAITSATPFAMYTSVFAGSILIVSLLYLYTNRLDEALSQLQIVNRELQQAGTQLESHIAERTRQLSEAQERTQQLLTELDEASRIARLANYELDVLSQTLIFNDRFYELLGTSFDSVGMYQLPLGQAVDQFVHPEDASQFLHDIQAVGTEVLETAREFLYRMPHADGRILTFSFRFVAEKDESGQIIRVKGAVQDITERTQAQEALRRTEDIYRQAIASADAVAYSRRYEDETFTFMGRRILNLTGYPAEEMTPALFDSLLEETIVHSTPLDHARAVEQARAGVAKNWKADYRLRTRDGRTRWVADNSVELIGPDNQSIGSVGIMLDITGRKESEEILARRAVHLETVTQLATIIATVTEPATMLQTVVDLTKSNFTLYHAHIYLLNEAGDTLELAAGAGEAGREMTAQKHAIPFNREQSLVARAARTRQGVIANDVTQAPDFLPNPWLPNTRSELAVPVIAGDTLLGVLDVQSDKPHSFTEEEVRIQTILAAQVAVALQNARANEQTTQTLQELDILTRRLTQEGWESYFQQSEADRIGFVLAEDEVVQVGENGQREPLPGKSVIKPVMLRGERIGQMAAAEVEMDEEEVAAILEAVSQGLSAHLENLRLNEQTERALADTRRRTEELALINRVVSAISATFDIQESMQIIVDALVESSSADQARIALINPIGNVLTIMAECFDPDKSSSAIGLEIPIAGNPLTEQVLATRQSQIVSDPQNDDLTAPIHHLMREQGIEQIIVVPMLAGNKVIGTLGIDLLTKERRFSLEELRLAETLVFQAATAVQNVRLFDQVQARARQEQILRQVSDRVYAAPDAESVLKTAAQEISRILGVEAIAYLSEGGSYDKRDRPNNGH